MKQSVGLILVLLVLFTFIGLEANAQRGGFGAGLVTVAEALRLRDDAPVIMQGRIERHIRSEYYMFADETGNMRVEIPPRIWGNLRVTQDDLIEITGVVDRHLFSRNRIYVRSIRLLQNDDE